MRKILLIVFLYPLGLLFSQENNRNYNLIVAFDSSLKLNREKAKDDLNNQIAEFSTILKNYDFELNYSFVFSEEKLNEMEQRALRISGNSESIQNLRNVFDVVNADLTDQDLQKLSKDLQKLPKVKYVELTEAKPVKPPFDIPPVTPNYVPQQTYLDANPGVNMHYAWDLGLNGQGIKIRDVEYEFNKNHEEFHVNPNVKIADNYTINPTIYTPAYSDFLDHGTGTLGILYGENQNFGVKGMAHGASEVILYPEWTTQFGYNPTHATSLALNDSEEGDVVLYEMQAKGATSESNDYVPAEYSQSIWYLTKAASDLGIIIVAAAGNGNQNLDSALYSPYMNRGNSGAIIVGAGSSTLTHSKMSYSTYGSRVNVQGWGQNVLSSGYGDYSTIGNDFNQRYTLFSGTSSATPIVASCVVVLQSYYHSLTGNYLNSAEMIDILQTTGIPQGAGGNIGPLPNMQAAIPYVQNLSREKFDNKPSFNIYPNPFESEINIISFDQSENVKTEIYNTIGQKVIEFNFSDQTTISTETLQTGVYFIKLTKNGKTTTYKVMKK